MERVNSGVEISDRVWRIAEIVGSAHPEIVEVRLFGSYATGTQKNLSDIAVIVDKKAPPKHFSNKGPVAEAVSRSLEVEGFRTGKGQGEIDLEIAGSGILELPLDSVRAIVTRAVLEGKCLFRRENK